MDKEAFLETDVGIWLQNCIEAWDQAIEERKKLNPAYSGESDEGQEFQHWDDICKRCAAQWEVYRVVLRQFCGMDCCFTRTEEYFGLVTEDEGSWLFKENRES